MSEEKKEIFEEQVNEGTAQEETNATSVSRRGFVYGGAGVAALLAIGGIGKFVAGDDTLLRPPGGQDERRLLGACIKCDRCRSACPKGVVAIAHWEDGIANSRTPKLSFKLDYCNFCEDEAEMRCIASCPTGALQAFDPATDKIGMAEVNYDECVLYRSIGAKCSKQCIAACPYEALSYDEAQGELLVDEDACNGCGACVAACPSASYTSYSGSGHRGVGVVPWKAGE